MKKRLVIITDCTDIALSEIRANILLQLKKEGKEIEIEPVVSVRPFSIINASFVLRLMTECYPQGTIFTVVFNPLRKITERIVIETKKKDYTIFTTNTGILGWVIDELGCKSAYEIFNPGFKPFGGKNVHAPAVGRFMAGADFKEIANPFDINKIRKFKIPDNSIVHIDNFGLMKIKHQSKDFEIGAKYKVEVRKNKLELQFNKRMRSLSDGQWALYPGSSLGLVELGCPRVKAANQLGAEIGDIVKFY